MSIKVANQLDRQITVGHGEYIIHHRDPSGKAIAPSRNTYDAIYSILNHFNSPSIDNRYDVIRSKIKSIDPSLEITFIPRTYYELHFLKKCIKEDLKRGDFCPNEQREPNPYAPNNTKDCWHLVHFEDEEDNQAEGVRIIAFKMNENLVKKINKNLAGQPTLSFQKISDMCNKQVQFFNQFANTFNLYLKQQQGQFCSRTFSEGTPLHKFSGRCTWNMKISSATDAAIIKNAVTLECHPIAEKSFLLYRGTDFPTDLPYSPQNVNEPYSFSFGSGLFAGALYRGGATGYVYMRDSKDAYVMAVPAQDLPHAPFVIPRKHAICHLSSHFGTIFHPRTQIWQTSGPIYGGLSHQKGSSYAGSFFCPLDKETLSDQVLKFKNNNVIFLNSSSRESMVVPSAFQPTIHIHAQIPLGKNLYIRGDSAGLNWQNGKPLMQVGDDHWIYRISNTFDNLNYKILLDDTIYEEGKNHELGIHNSAVEAPYFKVGYSAQPASGQKTCLTLRCKANSLTIRGNGPGLDWNKSASLKHLGADLWLWETTQHFNNFEFKLLLNDTKWESGPNHRVQHGKKEEIFPRF